MGVGVGLLAGKMFLFDENLRRRAENVPFIPADILAPLGTKKNQKFPKIREKIKKVGGAEESFKKIFPAAPGDFTGYFK